MKCEECKGTGKKKIEGPTGKSGLKVEISMLCPECRGLGVMSPKQRRFRASVPERGSLARKSDPVTSHEAAESLTSEKIRRSQQRVYRMLDAGGPGTDADIWDRLVDSGIHMSSSGARTRRKELVDLGLVKDTGKTKRLLSGRRSIIWGIDNG